MTGTPGQLPGGASYDINYRAELPEVMGRKLGLTDAGIALGQGPESFMKRRARKGQLDPNVLDPTHADYQETWDERWGGALEGRDIPEQQVAPWGQTGLQQKAYDILEQGVGVDPKTGEVTGLEGYLNPYQEYVTSGIEEQFGKARAEAGLSSSKKGAFGGARQGLQSAELARQQAEAVGSSLAQGYGQAQQLRMQDISSLMQVGEQQRQLTQQELDAQYRAKIQGMYEPYQRLGFVSDIMQGAPTSASSLAMATTPQANPLAQAVGAGISGLALYQGYQNVAGG
jgi:hypothetical protein